MKRFFVFLGVVFTTIGSAVSAQEVSSIAPLQKSSWGDVSLDTRFGYNQYFPDGRGRFNGDGLYLNIDGYINSNFSYSLQQRIASSYYANNAGFMGTNWLTLTYEVGDFAFTAGRDGLLVGSFEYDTDDLDTYYDMNSMFYNTLECWQWGASAEWYPAEAHTVILQAANSPFISTESNMFAYAAGWRMESDIYESYWTANLWEYSPGEYMKALNLGNRFHFGNFTVDLEYLTRAASLEGLLSSDDLTLIAALSYEWNRGRAFAKFGRESSDVDLPYELSYENGLEYMFYGAGVEFFPLKDNRNLRLHAAWAANNLGENSLNIGLKWRIDITSAAKKLFDKFND